MREARHGRRPGYSRKPGRTETRLRPRARRRESTLRPPWVFMRCRKPCVFERWRRLGWNVRFGMYDCAPLQKPSSIQDAWKARQRARFG